MHNKDIEIFDKEIEVVNRVNMLNQLGFKDEDMYIIASEDNDITILRGLTDIIIKENNDSLFERFKSFLKGEDTIIDAFTRMGLNEDEREYYQKELKYGKYLLYVNKEYGSYYQLNEDGENVSLATEPPTNDSFEDLEPLPESLREDVGLNKDQSIRDIDGRPIIDPDLNLNDYRKM